MIFTPRDLVNMRAAQDTHMQDTCRIRHYHPTTNDYNEKVPAYDEDSFDTICGLDQTPGSETHGAEKVILNYEATLRLPIDTELNARDQIKITKRFGETVAPIYYEIAGPIQRGPSGIRIRMNITTIVKSAL